MTTVLTNNFDLSVRINEEGEVGLVDIPAGSQLEYIKQSTGYHAYYEIHTYSLFCKYKEKNIIVSCSKYVGAKNYKIDCVKGNLHSNKKYYWSETFNEDFPEWVMLSDGLLEEKIQGKES